jgi:hypothetical protein
MANPSNPTGSTRPEDLGQTASRYATEAKRAAQDTAQNVAQKASEAASNIGHKAEEARSRVGDQMQSLAGTLREKAPHEGVTGSAASYLASGLESGGHYLQKHDFSAMANDVTQLIRRYPIQSLLIGFGVGFLLARAVRS